jgi:dipeptidase E
MVPGVGKKGNVRDLYPRRRLQHHARMAQNLRLLLGSGGIATEARLRVWTSTLRNFLGVDTTGLFIPYALANHDLYTERLQERWQAAGLRLDGIHRHRNAIEAIKSAPCIVVGGGNTFRLIDALHRKRLIQPLRKRVRQGVPFVGVSAGSNVACPTIKTTNDMPIVEPPSFDALGLVPFQINPHYFAGAIYYPVGEKFVKYEGETRDDRLREFHEVNPTSVVALWEGAILRRLNDILTLLGPPGAGARVFVRDKAPVDYQPEADLSFLLRSRVKR